MEHDWKFTSFIEHCDIGIFSFNDKNEFLDINSKFCGMIGYDRNELLNCTFPHPFWPEPLFTKIQNDFDVFRITGSLKLETFFCRKNNTYFPVELIGTIVVNQTNNDPQYVLLVQDISEKKKAEREFRLSQDMLIALNNKLENLVKQRTKQIQEVMKQKNEFINQLGHDLKNPLNPLINLLPVLHQKAKDDECQQILTVIDRNITYMRELITKTIELAKLDSPNIPFTFEPIKLKQEINKIIDNSFPFHNEKNIMITNTIPEDIVVDMDQLRLQELIINLVGNSLKYGKENGHVSITGSYDDNNHVRMTIIDDGQGMSADQLGKVFDEFYKGKQMSSTFKSSGLGMSICKRIVEKHGGTISCDSPGMGMGTTVTCILPKTHHTYEDEILNKNMENTKQITHEPPS